MGVVQVGLPEELSELIDRQVEAGRVENADAYLAEAIRRYAEDLEGEDEIIAQAELGILDAEAGRYTTISGPEDVAALEQRIIGRLQARLASNGG
jgi:antitoxin ParD1/3/4